MPEMMRKIEDRGGKLFVVDPWETMWAVPRKVRRAWPTGLLASEYPDLVGQACGYMLGSDGLVRTSDGRYVRLEFGARTKSDPAQEEIENVRRPNGQYIWARGAWRRR